MSRVQLAINVSDLASAIAFYSGLLSTDPDKVRDGYANFAVEDPPLKLVLIEQRGQRDRGVVGALNHLGIEVDTSDEVADSADRLSDMGLATDLRENTTCCYALQDKVWVDDPDQVPWEIYTVLADVASDTDSACGSGSSPSSHCC